MTSLVPALAASNQQAYRAVLVEVHVSPDSDRIGLRLCPRIEHAEAVSAHSPSFLVAVRPLLALNRECARADVLAARGRLARPATHQGERQECDDLHLTGNGRHGSTAAQDCAGGQ